MARSLVAQRAKSQEPSTGSAPASTWLLAHPRNSPLRRKPNAHILPLP